MSVLSSLDADLKKAADIENNIKAAEYNLHNDQPLINSLKAKVSEQKERINAHKEYFFLNKFIHFFIRILIYFFCKISIVLLKGELLK